MSEHIQAKCQDSVQTEFLRTQFRITIVYSRGQQLSSIEGQTFGLSIVKMSAYLIYKHVLPTLSLEQRKKVQNAKK